MHIGRYLMRAALLIVCCYAKSVLSVPSAKADKAGVQVKVHDAVFDSRKVPIAFAGAIEQDSTSKTIRLSWGYGAGGADTEGTALYDRKRKTVKYWLRDVTEFGVLTEVTLYENVSDESLLAVGKALEADPNDFKSPQRDYYLERLIQQGCKRTVLQRTLVKPSKR